VQIRGGLISSDSPRSASSQPHSNDTRAIVLAQALSPALGVEELRRQARGVFGVRFGSEKTGAPGPSGS